MKKAILFVLAFLFSYNVSFANVEGQARYISLAPSTTEILFALGLDEEIIAVSSFCDFPQAAIAKEKVGSFSQPNIEKILSLRPEIVFCTGLEQAAVVEKLKKLGVNVFVSDPSNITELFASIRNMGRVTNAEDRAEALVDEMHDILNQIKNKVSSLDQEKRPRVFVEIWHEPLMAAGSGSFVDQLISLAGGINIADDTIRPYSYFSAEQVIKRNPDYIILAYMVKSTPVETVRKRFGWSKISAVKKGQVYNDINPDLFLRPGPRLIKGLKEIFEKIHPEK